VPDPDRCDLLCRNCEGLDTRCPTPGPIERVEVVAEPPTPDDDRPGYAVTPLGAGLPEREELPPRPSAILDAVNPFHITNLGTLLDVLA
jgi:hypothetical protein